MSIAENLIEFIKKEKIENRINRDNHATLVFKIQDGKVVRMEGQWGINAEDVKKGGSK